MQKRIITNNTDIPYGYCHCGCGNLAPLAPQSDKRKGWVRGQPLRFLPGHHHNVRAAQPWEERFWNKVDKSAGPDACWPWTGTIQGGYGKFTKKRGQEQRPAHRLAYELTLGAIPEGMYVCRSCDNRICCNPAHFCLRTVAENNAGTSHEKTTIAERFWSKVQKESETACWLWLASVDHAGYGIFGFSLADQEYRMHHAQRVAWWLVTDQWPGDLFVCHRCDNPKCVNPSHLFLGTNQDNVDDKVQKQRHLHGESLSKLLKTVLPRGERHHNSKLTEDAIVEIRNRYTAGGISMAKLAKEYDVSFGTIHSIIHHRHWVHVQPDQPIPEIVQNNAKLTESQVIEIRALANQRVSHQELASKFNVIPRTIRNIVSRRTWKHVS